MTDTEHVPFTESETSQADSHQQEDSQNAGGRNAGGKPVWSRRLGFVEVAIWSKAINSTIVYNVKIRRSYKDKSGNWQHTDNLDGADIGNVIALLNSAQNWIIDQK